MRDEFVFLQGMRLRAEPYTDFVWIMSSVKMKNSQHAKDIFSIWLCRMWKRDALACSVVAPIADHNGVLTKFRFSLDTFEGLPRTVWNCRSAVWEGLIEFLATASFDLAETDDIHTATQQFADLILSSASRCILPWILVIHPSKPGK